jgi:hypothetical protein
MHFSSQRRQDLHPEIRPATRLPGRDDQLTLQQ